VEVIAEPAPERRRTCYVHNFGRFHIDLGEYRREAVVIERIVHLLRPALGNFKEVGE
jgi:hypothetical protein